MSEERSSDRETSAENEPSPLDDNTHAELCLLYKESADTLRFAKYMQWWTVGSTLLVFGSFIFIAKFVGADMAYAKILTGLIIFIAMAVIFTLIIYQTWQYNEQHKIEEIGKHFSSLFGKVRRIKSKRESNMHRYLLLVFMSITVVIGGAVSYFGVLQVVAKP